MKQYNLNDSSILRLVQIALAEDIGSGDLTSEALIDPDATGQAIILAKADGVVAGTIICGLVFGQVDRTVSCDWAIEEGKPVQAGTVLAHLHGTVRGLLAAERTALNFLQRMSGVATLTRRYVDAIAGTATTILDTRKTIPGWRELDKYAVSIGGGTNHRMGLYDMVMIKDNHIAAHGGIAGAVALVRERLKEWGQDQVKIEVETKTLDEVSEAVSCEGVGRIMFDNFPADLMRDAIVLVGGRCETEASGGITLANIREIAETGVQYISVGALTHSAPALDISLELRSSI